MIRTRPTLVLRRMRFLISLVLAACAATPSAPPAAEPGPSGRTPDGEDVRLELDGDQISAIVPSDTTRWLWPSVIDSHVHLAYWPVADALVSSGIAATVDLAAPESVLGERQPLHVIASGPMLTSDGGYPLDSWGADGYGVGCGDGSCVTRVIDRLAGRGARVIKIAVDAGGLDPALLPVAVEAAHRHRLRVAVHALRDRSASLAAAAGADLLAHTPVEALRPETVEAWRGRAVVSTLAAFGGSSTAIANLRALRAAGVTVLYGTDLGNLRDAGPSAQEIAHLREAGLDDTAIAAAMTTEPVRYWGLPFGEIAVAAEATFLVLERDPRTDASTLLAPHQVYLRGQRVR